MFDRLANADQIRLTEPMNYIGFMSLITDAAMAITDSGGIQEETTYLGIPCITLRENTERPVTVTHGTNQLAAAADLPDIVTAVMAAERQSPAPIDLWDGRTAARVAASLRSRIAR